jgi:chromatin segregation and condensation protein Rec8/ScpA/Scc1 (kleisin family)
VRFAELFESAASRAEVICTFLALLELIRLKQLVCVQPERLRKSKSAARKSWRQASAPENPWR